MEKQEIQDLIQPIEKRLCLEYPMITPYSLTALYGYCQYRLSDNWEEDTAPHNHFWIDMPKEQDSLWIASFITQKLGKITGEGSYLQITEQELLERPKFFLARGKKAFIIIDEFTTDPLHENQIKQWDQVKASLSDSQCPTFFLLASEDAVKQRFSTPEQFERYLLQIFHYRICTKNEYSIQDYQDGLNQYLDSHYEIKRLPEFDQGMTEYLETILPTATYHGQDFIQDLIKRVNEKYYEHTEASAFDQSFIPHYRKKTSAAPDISEDTKKGTSDLDNSKTTKQYFTFEPQPTGDFFEREPDEKEKDEVKNVLLLTLSITSYVKHMIRLSANEDPIPYYYQLEPIPYKLMYEWHSSDSGQKLDGILMICSKETKEPKDGKNEAFSPEDFKSSAYDYFVYQTAKFAHDHCNYALSFHEIPTYYESQEEQKTYVRDTIDILSSVLESIRELKKRYKNLNVYVDTHGGSRTDQEILNNALSLLQMEGINIKQDHIYSVDSKNYTVDSESKIIQAGEIFDVMDFVSGIHACANYGQAKSLGGYLGKCKTAAERNTLKNMQTIAEGIQLCDILKFEDGLSALSASLKEMERENSHTYLSIFRSLIQSIYGNSLLDEAKRNTIDEIKWCIEKDFIQQALTLVESKMPREIIQNNFLHCPELFRATPSGTIILEREKAHLEEENSPKLRWESTENFIFQKFGYTKKERSQDTFLDLSTLGCIDSISYFRGNPTCLIRARDNNTPWEERRYRIFEQKAARNEINIFVRLHMQLKQIRNETNHAGEDDDRFSIEIVRNALKVYVNLYEKILNILNH